MDSIESVLLNDISKITELEIHGYDVSPRIIDLTRVLQALACRPTLTKLELRCCPLDRDEARLLQLALCNIPSLQSLIRSAELAELAPSLYSNTSIKELNMPCKGFDNIESARLLRDILRRNKTMTALDLSRNAFGETTGAGECIVDGLCSNSTLLKIDLSYCTLRDNAVSTLVRNLGSRKATLRKLSLAYNSIHLGVLLCFSKRWNRTASTSRISTSRATGTWEHVS